MTVLKEFVKLKQEYQKHPREILDLFKNDSKRLKKFSRHYCGLYYDFSKNNINDQNLEDLLSLANKCNLKQKINDMFDGVKINITEDRAVLHTALRSKQDLIIHGKNIQQDIKTVQTKMEKFCNNVHSGFITGYSGKKINTVVNIGIGGSDLGIVLTSEALYNYRKVDMQIHFISSVDLEMAKQVLTNIDPETTIFIIASKTFTTQETTINANFVREWFKGQLSNNIDSKAAIKKHFLAVSNNLQGCLKFGIAEENIFLFWDFVGGRYSIWSAVGLALILYIGYENYTKMLVGAQTMDDHFKNTNLSDNIPVLMALVGIWNINICDYRSLLISPYNYCLRSLPAYLQQLEMESNGKSTNLQGGLINYQTSPVLWGTSANNAQHAYYQMLHQGTQTIPLDVIIAKPNQDNNVLFANAIAQSQAFMQGEENNDRHRFFKGNKPSNFLLLNDISPFYVGMLLALYEHKVFVQGVIWNINSFDQMGVELGKRLTNKILDGSYKNDITDSSTEYLIQQLSK
jgi:glucose-6-phosphate isomerase